MKKTILFLVMAVALTTQTLFAQVPSYVPTNGLVGYWPFSGNANDESGNGNNAVMQGNATFALDRYSVANSSYSGDLTSGADITSLNNFPFGNSGRTISLWFQNNIPYPGGNRQLFSYGDNNSGGRFGLFMDESFVGVEHVNGGRIFTHTPDGNWHNLVVTYPLNGSGTNDITIYFDGIGQASQSFNPVNLLNTANSYIHWIGTLGFAPGWLYAFSGKIDDIGIWNRALTQEEITNLYNANQCITNITVTDTLIINVGQLSFNDTVTWANNITIAPNPASSQINISFNNITNLNGGTLKIINSLGQEVATTPITTSGTNSTMQLATWGGTGMYFVQIINPQGQIVDIKKIILQ
jgi:hypothetical protein